MTSNLGIIWITTILLVGKRISNNQATWLNSLIEEGDFYLTSDLWSTWVKCKRNDCMFINSD